jgi:hypothetical protein
MEPRDRGVIHAIAGALAIHARRFHARLARMRRPALASLAIAIAIPACDNPAPPPPAASAAPTAAATAPSATAAAEALPPTPDLDVPSLQKALKCGGDAKSGACGILAKAASCKPFDPMVPSGDGRWLGRGYLVEGAKVTEQFTVVRARRVPTSEVGPGQLGVKIAVADIPKQEGLAFDQADRAIRAFERADIPGKSHPTMEYVKARTDWPERAAVRTAGGQVFAVGENGTYLCQGASRTVLVVQRAASRGASGDGLYAEVWPTSW